MKALGQMVVSMILGIVLLGGALGFFGACSDQDVAVSASASIGNSSAVGEVSMAMDAPTWEDWERLDAAIQKAEAYTDLSVYSDDVIYLFVRALENARASIDDPGVTKSLARSRAQQLESMMVVMDQETGAWMEKGWKFGFEQ